MTLSNSYFNLLVEKEIKYLLKILGCLIKQYLN